MDRAIVATRNAPAAIGPYSQAVIAGQTLVFTAGQIGIVPATGEIVQGDVKVQTRQALENIKAILGAAGSSLAGVIKTTVFLKEMSEFAAMNDVYAQYFPQSPPARSTVEIARLPRDARVEIEAIAVIPGA